MLGLIYRHFYLHCTSSTLLTLYFTLVRPILEYCSVIWDPSSLTTISALESVQCFALKLVSKSWSTDYNFLLSSLNITTLAQRRRSAKILTIFKLKTHLSHSINSPLQSPPLPPYFPRNYSPFNLIPIHCKSSSYFNSFLNYPSSIKLWNSLPVSIKSAHSLSYLKSLLSSSYN